MEFSGRGFKSHSGQLSMATSKNPSGVNTIYIYIYIHIYTYICIHIIYHKIPLYGGVYIREKKHFNLQCVKLITFLFFQYKARISAYFTSCKMYWGIFGEVYILEERVAYIRDVNCITYLGVYIRGGNTHPQIHPQIFFGFIVNATYF